MNDKNDKPKNTNEVTKDWGAIASEELEENAKAKGGQPEAAHTQPGEVSGILTHPDYKKLEEELTKAETRADQYHKEALQAGQEILRIRAETENMMRRTEREVVQARKYALESFAEKLLAVADSLEQALLCSKGTDSVDSMLQGIELTLKLLHGVFEQFSIKVFDPVGEKFDPSCHEAMSMVEHPDMEPGSILTVFQKGYWLNDRLLRPARVVVVKKLD